MNMNTIKAIFYLLLFTPTITLVSCGKSQPKTNYEWAAQDDSTWVQGLSQRNPFANDTMSRHFLFSARLNRANVLV